MYGAQSFLAKLDYVGPDDKKNPNRVHISIRIPHQDGKCLYKLIVLFSLTLGSNWYGKL
jgi:hypothetical protein